MFVIVQAWDNLPPDVHKNRDVAERIGLALKHAVSIIIVLQKSLQLTLGNSDEFKDGVNMCFTGNFFKWSNLALWTPP